MKDTTVYELQREVESVTWSTLELMTRKNWDTIDDWLWLDPISINIFNNLSIE